MQIETQRLIIREYRHADWIEVHKYASNEQVAKHTIWGPNSEDETLSYVEEQISKQQANDRTDYEFAVVLKESNTLIGGCGIYVQAYNAEIGYCFNPEYWGNGYATEAARALVQLGFRQFNVHRIYATCRPGNLPSAHVLQKIGMKQEGHLREHMWFKGMFHDSYLYSMIASEYH